MIIMTIPDLISEKITTLCLTLYVDASGNLTLNDFQLEARVQFSLNQN